MRIQLFIKNRRTTWHKILFLPLLLICIEVISAQDTSDDNLIETLQKSDVLEGYWISDYKRVDDWIVGGLLPEGIESHNLEGDGKLFAAHQTNSYWEIYIEGTWEFRSILWGIPNNLISDSYKILLDYANPSSNSVDSLSNVVGYKLPWPTGVTYNISRAWSSGDCNHGDNSVDAIMTVGSLILAMKNGTVTKVVQNNTACGCSSSLADKANYIQIDHGNGETGFYVHIGNNQALVSEGTKVVQGQPIAYSDQIGWTCGSKGVCAPNTCSVTDCNSGPHLHFHVIKNGVKQYITFDDVGTITGCNSYTSGNITQNNCCGCTTQSLHNDTPFLTANDTELSFFGLPGLENNFSSLTYSPSETELITQLPHSPDPSLFESLAPEWQAIIEPVETTTNKPMPPILYWPEAVGEKGEELGYLVYWGDDPQGTAEIPTTTTSMAPSEQLNPADGPTTRYLRVAARDDMRHISDWQTITIWQYDPVPPTGTLTIGSGGDLVNTLNVRLMLDAEDEGSQITHMRFSHDGQTWTVWEPYADQRVWQLAETKQTQTIYAQVQDEAGNVSEMISTTVTAELTLLPPTSTNFTLSCRTFGMGGGSKSSTSFTVYSTTGQPYETGSMQSGNYQVNSGYWSACGSTNIAPPTGSPIRISPANQTIALSEGEFCIDVTTADVTDLGGFEFDLSFPPALLQVTQASLGTFLTSTGRTSIPLGPTINNIAGSINFGAGTIGSQTGPTGSGTLANICLTPQQGGTATLDLTTGQLTDTSGNTITSYLAGGTVTIQGAGCYWADLDCDNDVDVVDIQKVAGRWGTQISDIGYSAFYDLDDDGDIDIIDVQLVASQWNWPNPVSQIDRFAASSPITISLTPEMLNLQPGETRQIALNAIGAVNLAAYEINLSFNPADLQVKDVIFTEFLSSTGRTVVSVGPNIDNQNGRVNFGSATFGSATGVSGDNILAYVEITALSTGAGILNLNDSQATEPDATIIQVTEVDASYSIYYRVFLPALIK